jgi:hypothetical protein
VSKKSVLDHFEPASMAHSAHDVAALISLIVIALYPLRHLSQGRAVQH